MVRPGDAATHWRERITVNPNVCYGRACVRGTRVVVSVAPDNLTTGLGCDEILKSYPTITREDIEAVLACAAELARRG